jgi:hypothetical protein
MCWKVLVTEVVPAPDEPVTAMIGCATDMGCSSMDVVRTF